MPYQRVKIRIKYIKAHARGSSHAPVFYLTVTCGVPNAKIRREIGLKPSLFYTTAIFKE